MKVEDFLEKALRIVVDEHKYDLFYISEKYITKVKSQYSDVDWLYIIADLALLMRLKRKPALKF
jgi:hypothetical protein